MVSWIQVDDGGSSKAELLARVRGVDSPGTSVTLTVERAGKKRPLEVSPHTFFLSAVLLSNTKHTPSSLL